MLTYPAWCTAVDQKQLEQALVAAKPPLVEFDNDPRSRLVFGLVQSLYTSDADALRAVRAVYEVMTRIVERQITPPGPADVRAFLDQVIVELDDLRPQTTSFDTFVQMVHAAVGVAVPMPPVRDGAHDDRVPLTVSQCAEQLQTSDDTILRLIHTNKLPAFKINTRWRIDQAELDRLRTAHPEKYPDHPRRRNSRPA